MKSKLKPKLLSFALIFGLILSLFTGCNGDASEQLFNGTGTEPIVKVTYTSGSSRSAKPETKIIKVPSGVVLNSFLADNDIAPESVQKLEFYGIREIQGNENNGTTFARCKKLTSVIMDEALKDIGEYAFYQTIDGMLPIGTLEMKAVERIGKYAFNGCNQLKEVTFPETVKAIEERAFYECSTLQTLVFTGNNPPTTIASDAFNSEKVKDVLVPKGSSASYKSAFENTGLKDKVVEKKADETTYTVTFNSNGGSEVSSQTVQGGGKAVPPAEPTRAGYLFVKWCSDEDLKIGYSFDTPVSANITLYAKWAPDPFRLVADASGATIQIKKLKPGYTSPEAGAPSVSLEYRKTGETEWTTYGWTDDTETVGNIITLNANEEVEIKAKNTNGAFACKSGSSNLCNMFVITGGNVAAKGNIMFLLDSSGETTTLPECAFVCLFRDCKTLTEAPVLPAAVMSEDCYRCMFQNCEALKTAPVLPATALADYCYYLMFNGCKVLENAPELPATTLAVGCYGSMFGNCIALESAPILPAITLKDSCYQSMFYKCTFESTPELSATTLATSCYQEMFGYCPNLKNISALPVTTLAPFCYYGMFESCSSLEKIPELPATELVDSCYANMFNSCSKIKISTTQEGYPNEYRIPSVGTGAVTTDSWNTNMFYGTGGSFKGSPTINTIYYTTNVTVK